MAFTKGDLWASEHYNNFVGIPTAGTANNNKALQPFSSNVEAANKVAAIVGVGYGQRGYGQVQFALPNVKKGDRIMGDHWLQLRNAIELCANHQGTDVSDLFSASAVSPGNIITAFDGGTGKECASCISTIEAGATQFLNNSGASMASSGTILHDQRAAGWYGTIYNRTVFTFSSGNTARYFFNSGGEIQMIISLQSGASEIVSLKATSNTMSGPGNIPNNIGYYGLTSSFTSIARLRYNVYRQADVLVMVGGDNTNGSKGNIITVDTRFTSTSSAGIYVDHSVNKAVFPLVNIETPSLNRTFPLSAGGAPPEDPWFDPSASPY